MFTHLESCAAQEAVENKHRSHGQPAKITKCLIILYCLVLTVGCRYLQVDLLSVGILVSKGSIDHLLEGEREDGGDPGVARGTHLSKYSWKN